MRRVIALWWLGWAMLVLGSAGCGTPPARSCPAVPPWQLGAAPDQTPLPVPEVNRLGTGSADEFAIMQHAADYASDLPCGRCNIDDRWLKFHPVGPDSGSDPLGQAAYALYRLQLDPTAGPATLTLAWDGDEPAQCWIGLADWPAQAWWWAPLPLGGELTLPEPARFADASQHCYAAILVLGSATCTLKSVGFGELPPEPTSDGYTLFTPITDTNTYLINMAGEVVHTWASRYAPGMAVELTEDGHLIRQCVIDTPGSGGGSLAGRLEEYDWDGNLVWYADFVTPTQITHHDFVRMPNGNFLCIVQNSYPRELIVAAGRNPEETSNQGLWADSLAEIEPTGSAGSNLVWEWYTLDHVVQDFDATLANYGDPAAHAELIDINAQAQLEKLDWTHFNAVDYNAELDQIVISVFGFSEVWIIDHSTTIAEAASHQGGVQQRGGDLLYRWGNPQVYRAGTAADRQLYFQHSAHWIPPGLDGAGNLMVFNNHAGLKWGRIYSTVVEFTPPLNPDGSYQLAGGAYGPAAATWEYTAAPPESLYSSIISSAQRLPGGNTLVCSGIDGWFFEVTPAGKVVWEYHNPYPTALPGEVFRVDRYPEDYSGLAALR